MTAALLYNNIFDSLITKEVAACLNGHRKHSYEFHLGESMICPSCKQQATTFIRYAFSLQGVSIFEGMKGYFKCQHCGTLLCIAGYGKHFWTFLVGTIISVAAFATLYPRLMKVVGMGVTAAIWVVIIVGAMLIFSVGIWKYARIEKVDGGNS